MEKVAFDDMKMVYKFCGFDVLMKLLELLPGITIDIPKVKKSKDIELVEEICGKETSDLLMKFFSGKKICVPRFQRDNITILKDIVKKNPFCLKLLAVVKGYSEKELLELLN